MDNLPGNLSQPARVWRSGAARTAPEKPGAVQGLRSTGIRHCPGCGAASPAQASVCPECGENLQTRPRKVHCRRCGGRATSELVLCPHCGRELHAAPPRLVSIGLPIFLSLLALAVLVSRWEGGNPLSGALARIGSLGGQVVRFDAVEPGAIEPDRVIVMTPVPSTVQETTEQPQAEQAAVSAANVADAGPSTEQAAQAEGNSEGAPPALQSALDATVPAQAAIPPPTDTPEQPETSAVTPAGAAALMPLPASTPTPEPTATEAPTEAPTATATDTAVPVAGPEVAAASVAPITHRIRPGETLLGIAQQYDVTVDDLMRVNNISASQVFVLQPGQTLIIPANASAPTPTNTPAAEATQPPATATAAPTSAPTDPAIRLDAPILRSPENGTPVSCSEEDTLIWLGVPFIKAGDKYLLHLGFVSGRTADNQEEITWVLHQPSPANLTSWDLDPSLCGLAPQAYGRQWRWWVEVVEERDGELVPVSRPSATWAFSWN